MTGTPRYEPHLHHRIFRRTWPDGCTTVSQTGPLRRLTCAHNVQRAEAKHRRLPGAESIVNGDLATLQQMRSVADEVNALGIFDAIIHNAAVGCREPRRVETEDGLHMSSPSTASRPRLQPRNSCIA
jgi:NAD(P)-dependent dehydrogenase (short-subunit alcohol dehydrogenase family)